MDLEGDAAIRAFPDRFDERQRPKCGVWGEWGPCICGDPERHRAPSMPARDEPDGGR